MNKITTLLAGLLASLAVQSAELPAQAPATSVPAAAVSAASTFDYSKRGGLDTFGSSLFTGTFAQQGASQFNPDYVIATGDQLQVRLWGGYELDTLFTVDPKGNIFLPHVGPVNVLGVRNQELQATIDRAVRRVFSANVFSYASLAAAQPVRVFVSGNVYRPGLYSGTSMDSLLHYLDLAGGIDLERGSFLSVQVKRAGNTRAEVNLYDFLLDGRIPLVQFADGDVIFVSSRQSTVKVSGLVRHPNRFEFRGDSLDFANLVRLAGPSAQVTNVRITRNSGATRDVDYFPISEASSAVIRNGDEVSFTVDRKPGTITVRVEGEIEGPQEFVLPYGAKLGDLLQKVRFTPQAQTRSVQLFRESVRERQRLLLDTALRSLEASALTARSGTNDEAGLRAEEAEMVLKWIDRARRVDPIGQVYIAGASARDELLLENGDLLKVPKHDGLVLISGEVLFPNAVAFDADAVLGDYIERAGGYSQNADVSRVVIARNDGSFEAVRKKWGWFRSGPRDVSLRSGDEVLVLPKIDVKSRQVAKDLSQILYQLAVTAKVVSGF